jgi:hypothetical protein
MKKKSSPKKRGFDEQFDAGEVDIDFSKGVRTEGLGKVVRLPPMTIPVWLAAEIESLSQLQANSKASVIRQLLVEAIEAKKKSA